MLLRSNFKLLTTGKQKDKEEFIMKKAIQYETPKITSEKIFNISAGGISLFTQCYDHGNSWNGAVNRQDGACKSAGNQKF